MRIYRIGDKISFTKDRVEARGIVKKVIEYPEAENDKRFIYLVQDDDGMNRFVHQRKNFK